MQIVVNHLTRMMSESRICIAGIDLATRKHVRPVAPATDLLTRTLLRENSGPFGVGALVDLGSVEACPNPPENEDHRFETSNARAVENLEDDVYLELLKQVGDPNIASAFGSALVEVRTRKFAIRAGEGERSLAVMRLTSGELHMKFGNLYLSLRAPHTPAEMRVTDVRFYEADHRTVKRALVDDVNRRLQAGEECHLMMGLARALHDAEAGDVHWLMANGLCLADRAVSDIP